MMKGTTEVHGDWNGPTEKNDKEYKKSQLVQ